MTRLLVSSLLFIVLTSCGVPQKDKEEMYVSLKVGLEEAFAAQDSFIAFLPQVELNEVKRGDFFSISGYRGQFNCSFEDRNKNVRLYGVAGFDKTGSLAKMPNGKLAIDIYVITVDNTKIEHSSSIYNVPMFNSCRASLPAINNKDNRDSVLTTGSVNSRIDYTPHISLKEYVEGLRTDGNTMFHIEGDNVLIFTRWDDPVGGNANSQAEALYRQAKAANVYNIKTVRVMKMPERKIVGRYVSR